MWQKCINVPDFGYFPASLTGVMSNITIRSRSIRQIADFFLIYIINDY